MIADVAYIRKAGVPMVNSGKELVPDHALAVSTIVSGETVAISLKEEALQYLRKEEVIIASPRKELS